MIKFWLQLSEILVKRLWRKLIQILLSKINTGADVHSCVPKCTLSEKWNKRKN